MNKVDLFKQAIEKKLLEAGLMIDQSEVEHDCDIVLADTSKKQQKLTVQVLDLGATRDRFIKVKKLSLNYEQSDKAWIALVLVMPEMEAKYFLIPTSVFIEPDDYIFKNFDIAMLPQLSNWHIKVFPKGMEKLSEYSFAYQVENLK